MHLNQNISVIKQASTSLKFLTIASVVTFWKLWKLTCDLKNNDVPFLYMWLYYGIKEYANDYN